MKAPQFLQAGLDAMQQRAATYDKPEGERSMSATVEAFKAITGHAITEEQGWLFMAILKAVRSQQGNYSADSYVDGAAYFGLAGEAAHKARSAKPAEEPDNAPAWPDDPKWRWMAQDLIGSWVVFTHKPVIDHMGIWVIDGEGDVAPLCQSAGNPNWRHTLRQRPAPTTNAGPMLHCPDCTAEHCPCVAR